MNFAWQYWLLVLILFLGLGGLKPGIELGFLIFTAIVSLLLAGVLWNLGRWFFGLKEKE